jgi:glycerophosphoryl diester phosphodiesterase
MTNVLRSFNVQAHRCFGGEEAANCYEAFEKAANSGIHSIETDVFLSKDDVMYIIHGDSDYGLCEVKVRDDPTAPWHIAIFGELTSDYIDTLTYKKSEGKRICRLTDLLKVFKGTDKILNIEIKEFDPRISSMIVDAFLAEEMLHQLFVSSFYHYHRQHLHKYLKSKDLPHVSFGFLTFNVYHGASEEVLNQTMPGDSITVSHAALRRYISGFPELFRRATEKDLKINIWFDGTKSAALETLENYTFLADLGIHTFITNCPSKALDIHKALCTPEQKLEMAEKP